MKIIDFLKNDAPHISCELFPPKKWENIEAARKVVAETALLKPDYMSVTYGATGGTSKYTVDLVDEVQNKCGIPALGHLTCVSSDRETVDAMVRSYKEHGIENILALRGDIPSGSDFEPSKDFKHACDLMAEIKSKGISRKPLWRRWPSSSVHTTISTTMVPRSSRSATMCRT